MERRFTIHDFEKSLREQADEFRMIPSKRVWHGIYNDLQPGRRWPSFSTSFLLLFSLLFVGYLNSNQKPAEVINAKSVGVPVFTESPAHVPASGSAKSSEKISEQGATPHVSGYHAAASLSSRVSQSRFVDMVSFRYLSSLPVSYSQDLGANLRALEGASLAALTPDPAAMGKTVALQNAQSNPFPSSENYRSGTDLTLEAASAQPKVSTAFSQAPVRTPAVASLREATLNDGLQNELLQAPLASLKKPVILNIAFRKAVNSRRRMLMAKKYLKQKTSWLYYLAPQMSAATFNGAPLTTTSSVNYTTSVTLMPASYKLLHYQAVGFQAGAQMNYRFWKKLSLTSAVQLSYSGYNIISNEVHPTFATLFLKDPSTGAVYPRSYISHYGDGTGQTAVSLRNYSMQISLPVGLAYEFAGNARVQFNAAADLAPSFVVKSNAFILSSDGNNYVNDPTLIRKWNAASNFGLYVSFWSSRVRWQIGPNVRYQWLSTYKKDYSIGEHLVDYGIRIGISR